MNMCCLSLSCSLVPLCVSENKSGLSAGPLFLLGYTVYSGSIVDAETFQERTLDGGAARSLSIKVSWDSSSEEGGAAHGPLHPALFNLKAVLILVSLQFGCFGKKVFCLGLLFRCFALRENCMVAFSEPFKLWVLFRSSCPGLFHVGSPPGWGVHRHRRLVFFRRHECTTDRRGRYRNVRFVLCLFPFCFSCFRRDGGACAPTTTAASTSSLATAQQLCSLIAAFTKAWHPPSH